MSSKQVGLRRTNPNIVLKTREITTKVKRKPNEPSLLQPEITPKRQKTTSRQKSKLDRPLMKLERKKMMLELFEDDDSPIRRLPYDCLLMIFRYCPLATLISLSNVNHSWRKITQNSSLWKDSTFPWIAFQQLTIGSRSLPRLTSTFGHVRTLTITVDDTMELKHFTHSIKYSPFEQVETLNMICMPLRNIQYATIWTPNITSLNCQDIPVEKNEWMVMPKFKGLEKLRSLKLKFAQPYSLRISPFLNRFSQDIYPDVFPSTLRTLELANLTDEEGASLIKTTLRDYLQLRETDDLLTEPLLHVLTHIETEAARKYSIFCSLSNLTSLSLDRLSAFTTVAWSKYMQLCSKKLTFISLKGYMGRIPSLNMTTPEDYGLSQFIGSLSSIETIFLDDFLCTPDLILGLKKLTESDKTYHIENTIDNATDITKYIDKQLYNFCISIRQIKKEVMTV